MHSSPAVLACEANILRPFEAIEIGEGNSRGYSFPRSRVPRSLLSNFPDGKKTAMKTWLALLLTALLTSAAAVAQTDLRTATVEGTVKNLKTGEPIPDVRVTVTPDPAAAGTRSATTDGDGRFTITAVSPGRHTLSATRTLFFRPRRDAGPVALTVAAGERIRGLEMLLSPTGVIAGRVVDDRREPLRSIRVEALRREYRDGVRVWAAAAQNTTDDRGEYRLFNLPPGSYYVRATGNLTTSVYYPGITDPHSGVPVAIEAGSEAGAIDIEIRRSPEYAVQLRLGDVPPGSTANFTIRRRNGLANEVQPPRSETLPDNTYRLAGLPPGEYDIFVQVSSPPAVQPRILTHAMNIPVTVGSSNVDLGTVAVRPTTPVTGRIVVPDPIPSALVPARLVLTLRALDLPMPLAFNIRGDRTPPGFNPDGTFALPNVAVGRYQILLTGLPADAFVVSAREGTREVLDGGFTVSGTQNPLEVTVGGPGSVGTVTGTVINALGQPVPSSTVVLVPTPDRRINPAAFRSAIADQGGNFSIRSVLAGEYRALAWEDIEPGIYVDPEFLKPYETRGESFRLQRGSQNAVTVRVIPSQ